MAGVKGMFEVKHKDGLARICEFQTKHGTVETPNIMPVINPNLLPITPRRMQEEFGTDILITNSYVIYTTEELKERALKVGLHSMLDFSGSIMTDSGTFQNYVYGDVDVGADEILEFQIDIDTDIATILDEFTEPEDARSVVEKKVDTTIERGKEAMDGHGSDDTHIALPVQGSIYPGIRERCGKAMGELNGSFYPIGGVVPLLEDYRFRELVDVIISSKKGLGPRGPVHLFGAGHPMIYPLAVLLGCDLFDSSSYIKYARRGDLMYSSGTKNLDEIEHLACHCPVCESYTASELKELPKKEQTKLLAEHNLWISYREIEKIKQAIKDGSLWELVERRARSHPYLLDSLKAVYKEWSYLERFEPRSRSKALFYTGDGTLKRPSVKRIMEWIWKEYRPPNDGPTVIFDVDEGYKPYDRYIGEEIDELLPTYDVNLLLDTVFGPVPAEMSDVYPIAQSLVPHMEKDEERLVGYLEKKGIEDWMRWDGDIIESLNESKGCTFDELKVKTVSDYQFFKGAGRLLSQGELDFVKNRKGRIRNVLLDGDHILSSRHYDGLFTLKEEGAWILHNNSEPPVMRIIVDEDSEEYNRTGKNVFCKFVIDAWNDIRAGDEVLIVNENDELCALARAFLNREEIRIYEKGLAARTRTGIEG